MKKGLKSNFLEQNTYFGKSRTLCFRTLLKLFQTCWDTMYVQRETLSQPPPPHPPFFLCEHRCMRLRLRNTSDEDRGRRWTKTSSSKPEKYTQYLKTNKNVSSLLKAPFFKENFSLQLAFKKCNYWCIKVLIQSKNDFENWQFTTMKLLLRPKNHS